jgi:hypothetical protein
MNQHFCFLSSIHSNGSSSARKFAVKIVTVKSLTTEVIKWNFFIRIVFCFMLYRAEVIIEIKECILKCWYSGMGLIFRQFHLL